MESATLMVGQHNPWSAGESYTRRAYKLSRRYGSTNHEGQGEVVQASDIRDSPSVRLIKLLEQRSHIRKNLHKVDLDIEQRMLDRETSDITYLNILEERIGLIQSLNNHLQSVIDSKTQLITRLQQPFVGDYIKLEAQYHRFASELFPQIAPMLADLNNHLENITWNKSLSFEDGTLDDILTELNAVLATEQTYLTSLLKVRENMDHLYEYKVD